MGDNSIKRAVEHLAGTHLKDEVTIVAAEVDSVDVEARTCTVTTIGGTTQLTIPNVRLQAEVADGFLLIPVIDSTVFIAYTKRQDPYVSLFSDIDRLYLVVGKSSFEVLNDGTITLNDGSKGGLVMVTELVSKLNALEKRVNQIASSFGTWTPVPNDGGGALKAASSGWAGQTITETVRTDIENTKVTHGS